jgi:carbohydrate-selective porin OprB
MLENDSRKSGFGSWTYTKKFSNIEDNTLPQERSWGSYYIHEENLKDNLAVFARFGIANPKASMIENNLAFGGVYKGIAQTDLKDEIGLGLTRAQFSKQYTNGLNKAEAEESEESLLGDQTSFTATQYKRAETTYEMYY